MDVWPYNRNAMTGRCELCQREARLSFHHLVPRKLHANKWFKKRFTRDEMLRGIDLCRECHSAVHSFIGHKDMGREYHTRERLLAHPKVANFVKWVRGKRVRHSGR